jgi:hypothetical protein
MKDGVTLGINIMLAQLYNGKISKINEKLFKENKHKQQNNSNNGVLGHIYNCDKEY